MQIAGQVDTLVDNQDTAAAVPLMRRAAQEVLAGRNKLMAWASGGPLPCPLAEPLCPVGRKACVEWFRRRRRSSPDAEFTTGSAAPISVYKSAIDCGGSDGVDTPGTSPCQSHAEGNQSECLTLLRGSQNKASSEACTDASEAADTLEPLFLARFDAAWIFCELATMYVSYLERQKEYQEACELLQALLGGSACPSRRRGSTPHSPSPTTHAILFGTFDQSSNQKQRTLHCKRSPVSVVSGGLRKWQFL